MKYARARGFAAAILATTLMAGPAHAKWISTVVMSGLDNPRGLEFGPDGGLYVAESGAYSEGGPTTILRGLTFTYGNTGAISRLLGGVQERILTGLPHLGSAVSNEASGPQDIVFGADGTGYVLIGLGANPAVRTGDLAPDGGGLGKLWRFTGGLSEVSDVAGFEGANNPTGGPVDANPYKVASLPDGFLVSDAGGNSVLKVAADGSVSLVASLPGRFLGGPPPVSDTVPTGIAIGPDGNYYVAELTGFPFPAGAARIYRITPAGEVSIAYEGFTNIADIAFDDEGQLFVLELDSNGRITPGIGGSIIRIGLDGIRSTIFSTGLFNPTGMIFGPDGALYVSNWGDRVGIGEVLRIEYVPEPAMMALFGLGAAGLVIARERRRKRLAKV